LATIDRTSVTPQNINANNHTINNANNHTPQFSTNHNHTPQDNNNTYPLTRGSVKRKQAAAASACKPKKQKLTPKMIGSLSIYQQLSKLCGSL
jgi:hypothetical protein